MRRDLGAYKTLKGIAADKYKRPSGWVSDISRVPKWEDQLCDRLRALPGVIGASVENSLQYGRHELFIEVEDREAWSENLSEAAAIIYATAPVLVSFISTALRCDAPKFEEWVIGHKPNHPAYPATRYYVTVVRCG
jgi:hypothetical protein